MKKSSYVALVLGTISCLLFGIGICMSLLEEWNCFQEGIIVGGIGFVLGLMTVFIWRRMEHKESIHISIKLVLTVVIAIIGTLGFGFGMVNVMVWDQMIKGIVIGVIGIIILLSLIPFYKGLKD